MKKSKKAALLSFFVFPGAGHVYLRSFLMGGLLVAGATIASYIIITNVLAITHEVLAIIQAGYGSPDFGAIAKLVHEHSRATGESTTLASIVLFALWLIGIFDSFRVGRKFDALDAADQATRPPGQQS